MSDIRERPYTIKELAERWNCSTETVLRRIRKGELSCIEMGARSLLVPANEVRTYEMIRTPERFPAEIAAAVAGSVVYFIEAEQTRLIKIGYARELRTRFTGLTTANSEPLRLLARAPGARKREQELHAQFISTRCHGEWFKQSDALRMFIAEQRRIYGLPSWYQVESRLAA